MTAQNNPWFFSKAGDQMVGMALDDTTGETTAAASYDSPYEGATQQAMMNIMNRPRLSEDPAALAYLESELGSQGSEWLKARSESVTSQGRSGGGAAFAGQEEAMQKSALARGAAIAGLKDKELKNDLATAQLLGQQWQADLEKMRLEKQEEWNAVNFWGQFYALAAGEQWFNNKNMDFAIDVSERGYKEILEKGGTTQEAAMFVWETISPHMD